ncbi:MAG: DUF1460 domain-containing protein [Bacteroidales bacterium]|nr:DUF1460 domain-containing protein [Bacteroidales bacterium]
MKRTARFFMALLAMTLGCQESSGQRYITTDADKEVAARILATLHENKDLSTPELMVIAAKDLLGTPYVASTLEEDPFNEELRVYLTKTDCILFVETCLNLARTVKQSANKVPGFDAFAANVAKTRYRKAPPYTYSDRIHYTTDWLRRQEGSLEDLTLSLGGKEDPRPINFMTRHPKSYKQLADADNIPRAALDLGRIGEVEDELNKIPMTYIPKDRIAAAAKGIRSGDIICFVSSVEGLDIAHVAIAYVEDGRVGFIHASQADGKVEIDGRTIEEYVRPRSNLSGIKVVRPL